MKASSPPPGRPPLTSPGPERRPPPSREHVPAVTVLAATVLLMLGMRLASPGFGSLDQISAILVTAVFLVVASFGQGLVILLGGIDLSMGVVISIGGMMIAGLTRGEDAALWTAIPLTLAVCTAVGLLNGLLVAWLRIPPFIATLSSSITAYGAALGFSAGSAQQAVAPALQRFMTQSLFSVPYPLWFMAGFVLAAWLFQNRSVEGRQFYAIGSSPAAATVAGLPIGPLTVSAYAISGLCAGITGILLAGYSSSATLDMGNALLMPTIAAVVIGGARVTGGSGIYLGTFVGALFLSVLSTVITALSLSQGLRSVVQGGIILLALLLQSGRLFPKKR